MQLVFDSWVDDEVHTPIFTQGLRHTDMPTKQLGLLYLRPLKIGIKKYRIPLSA